MRVSEQQRFHSAASRVEKAKDQNLQLLGLLSSQKKINALHDDPLGAGGVVRLKDRLADMESYQKNLNFSRGFLDVTETAITTIHERLSRAQELAVGMSNDTNGPQSRGSTAKEISQIMDEIVQMGNSRYGPRYVFSGFRTQSPSVDTDGVFLGDDGAIFLHTERDVYKRINLSGRLLFEATPDEQQKGHFALIETLQMLREGLESNDRTAIHRSIDELNFHMDRVSSLQASVGAVSNTIDESLKQLELYRDKEKEALSLTEDVDIYQATSDFKRTEAVLQSTLIASNKLLQPSLLNYIT